MQRWRSSICSRRQPREREDHALDVGRPARTCSSARCRRAAAAILRAGRAGRRRGSRRPRGRTRVATRAAAMRSATRPVPMISVGSRRPALRWTSDRASARPMTIATMVATQKVVAMPRRGWASPLGVHEQEPIHVASVRHEHEAGQVVGGRARGADLDVVVEPVHLGEKHPAGEADDQQPVIRDLGARGCAPRGAGRTPAPAGTRRNRPRRARAVERRHAFADACAGPARLPRSRPRS